MLARSCQLRLTISALRVVRKRPTSWVCLQRVHLEQELGIIACFAQTIDEQFHRFNRRKWIENLTQDPYALQIFLGNEQLFFAGAGTLDINGGKYPLIHKLAVQNDFHVAGALELFE